MAYNGKHNVIKNLGISRLFSFLFLPKVDFVSSLVIVSNKLVYTLYLTTHL